MDRPHAAARGRSGVILVGGRSSRMGEPKERVDLAGEPLLRHVARAVLAVCDELVLVAAPTSLVTAEYAQSLVALASADDASSLARVRVVHDSLPHTGPSAGLASGLAAARGTFAFAAACDTPLLRTALIRGLFSLAEREADVDAVIPLFAGRLEPLVAVYRAQTMAAHFTSLAERGYGSPRADLDSVHTRPVSPDELAALDADGRSFLNVNAPEDLERARALLAADDQQPG